VKHPRQGPSPETGAVFPELKHAGESIQPSDQPYKIRFSHPKGVFRFKIFEEMDAWDAIYKVPIRVK
jgi:hypothetical protein